jgi:hypothetical protein
MKLARFFVMIIMGWMVLSSNSFGYSGGTGEPNTPYQIADVTDLLQLAATTSDYTESFILTADIDLDPNLPGGHVFTSAIIAPDISTSGGFQGTPFEGTFDGNGHVLYNLKIESSPKDYIGLFGSIRQGQIQNLRLENVTVTGCHYVGGMAGCISKSSIANCLVTGAAVGNKSLGLGGLAGFSIGSTITDCHSNVALDGTGSNVGGLVGSSFSNSAVSNCSATGTITVTDSNGSGFSVGGLVGNNCSSTITYCRAAGDITVISTSTESLLNSNIGGLAGEDRYGTITHSYAVGSINTAITSESAITCGGGGAGLSSSNEMSDSYAKGSVLFNGSTESDYFIGGMIGLNYEGSISRCYSAGMVRASGNLQADNCVGGFCGDVITDAFFEDTGNFWDTETSGKTASAMGLGKTTAEMKAISTFTAAGWDFATTWTICEGTNYPRLQWQIPAGDWVCPDGVGMEDLSVLSSCWLETVQVLGNAECRMMDLYADGTVDLSDWTIFAGNWMEGI